MAKKTTDSAAPDAASATPESAPVLGVYEVLATGPIKIGGVLAYKTAQVRLTTAQADALNAAQPGSVQFIGI
jgi:hypothetical protein